MSNTGKQVSDMMRHDNSKIKQQSRKAENERKRANERRVRCETRFNNGIRREERKDTRNGAE